jgi:hypothetical protein
VQKHWFHARKNLFFRHKILLAETDAFSSRPPVNRPFKVRCGECRKEYIYKPTEVLRVEHEPEESFTPQTFSGSHLERASTFLLQQPSVFL